MNGSELFTSVFLTAAYKIAKVVMAGAVACKLLDTDYGIFIILVFVVTWGMIELVKLAEE